MLTPDPTFLAHLVARYETLHAEERSPEVRRSLDDVSYTLCVSTGTRDIDSALTTARRQLPGEARPRPEAASTPPAQAG